MYGQLAGIELLNKRYVNLLNSFANKGRPQVRLNNLTKKLFPNICIVLDKIPNLNFAAIFKQPSGATIRPHKHMPKNLICHFLLNDLKHGKGIFTYHHISDKLQLLFDVLCKSTMTNNMHYNSIVYDLLAKILFLSNISFLTLLFEASTTLFNIV